MRVDAHQHFWALERGDYNWLTPELGPIYRDFRPDDLTPHLRDRGIVGTILVQAAPTVAETQYMLSLAAEHPFILGVVGWVDFEHPDAPSTIAMLAEDRKLVGLRPMIQSIEDTDWMLGPKLRPAYEALISHGLVFDALTLPRHLKNLRKLTTAYPGMKVVIDHGSKPEIAQGNFSGWADDMANLARETSAIVKFSGLVTEAGNDWTVERLKPYVDHLLEFFGPSRLIWGSDWPVCTLASSYERWCDATDELLDGLSGPDKALVLGENAFRVYKLISAKWPA